MATRRRRRRGWLAWWCEPVSLLGTGRRRSRSRSRSYGSWGPGSLWWWLASPGSTPPARYGRITDPPRTRVSAGRHCPICGKAARCRCRMVSGEPIRRPRRRPGAAPYAYPPDFRAQGAVWCGNCRYRINTFTGHCTNTKCPR